MRLIILNYEYPPLGGGAGVCAQFHAEGLAAKGHDVKVITTWFEGEKEIEKKGLLEIIRLKSRRKKKFRSNPLEMLSWAIHSIHFINKNKLYKTTDLVLAHFTIPGGLVALHFSVYKRLPYIIISHGQDIPWFCPRELFLYHALFYFPIKLICKRAKKVTVLSELRYQDAIRLMGRKQSPKVSIIPNGCNIEFFKPDYSKRNDSKLNLIYIGRLTRQKDPFTMLSAIKKLNIPYTLKITGDGPLRKKMEQYTAQYKLSEHIEFTGWLSKQDLLNAYQQSHVLIISSVDEGMSLGMIEALSCGLYVITTPVSGYDKWILRELNGDVFQFGQADQPYAMIETYYHKKFKPGYLVPYEILEQKRTEMSWENIVEQYHQLISQ